MFEKVQKTLDPWIRPAVDAMRTVTGPTYVVSLVIMHLLYFLAFFGFVYVKPEYISELTTFIQVVICLFLMIRFNPFRDPKITAFDVKIIFSASIFILTNIGVTGFLDVYLNHFKEVVRGYVIDK
jgi:hypothetical protein